MRRKFLTLSHKDAETQRLSMQSYIHFVTLQEKCNYLLKEIDWKHQSVPSFCKILNVRKIEF